MPRWRAILLVADPANKRHVQIPELLHDSLNKFTKLQFVKITVNTYIGSFPIILRISHISCQTKVSNFHDVIFSNKNVSGSKVSMNTLHL